jgi:transcriptional regulator with XRE-family HTH domain
MENYYLIDLRKVGLRIKQARRNRNLTQEQASEMANLTAQYWSLVENGQRASINAYLQIAAVLDLTLNDLFYEQDKPGKSAAPFSYSKLISDCTDSERHLVNETLSWLGRILEHLRKG